MSNEVKAKNLFYDYEGEEAVIHAVRGVSLEITGGTHVAILGRNGSGKSTLAKLLSALEWPKSGELQVGGILPLSEEKIWEIRRICAMVFQNPDNQIIGTTVEEDIAFGPENLGIPSERIRKRVDLCARIVGLQDYLEKAPSALSGGQKQKLAVAGVLAMEPRILILDEATSMLDPLTRKELMAMVTELGKTYSLTILNITHHMNEALMADQVYVMDDGQVVAHGSPEQIFSQPEKLLELGLDVPAHTAIAHRYHSLHGEEEAGEAQVPFDGAVAAVVRLFEKKIHEEGPSPSYPAKRQHLPLTGETVIRVKDLSYEYPSFAEKSQPALQQVSFEVKTGEIFGIMGHTGSGKSTLIQHLNGLLRPQSGEVLVCGRSTSQGKGVQEIRRSVGLLFQYPEHQLFAETLRQDIAYGPEKLGFSPEEVEAAVEEAVRFAGLDPSLLERSPFELSGGQKRRAALAGVLAMRPKVLVMDEPAAALDPAGREEILDLVENLQAQGVTIILVSHSMEDLARVCDRILILKEGKVVDCGRPEEVFRSEEALHRKSLTYPAPTRFALRLKEEIPELELPCFSIGDVVRALLRAEEGRRCK